MKEISAGGVVYREGESSIQILMIEDRYHKLAIPKGKQEENETLEETALREIKEETGIDGAIEKFLDKISYQYQHATHGLIDKEVNYYLVRAIGGKTEAQLEEINQIFWIDYDDVLTWQRERGYSNNQGLLEKACALLQERG